MRNYGASLGMAILGTILISRNVANVESSLSDARPADRAGRRDRAQPHRRRWLTAVGAHPGRGIKAQQVFEAIQGDFAASTRVVFFVMAGSMAVAAIVALLGLRPGRQEELVDDPGTSARRPHPPPPDLRRVPASKYVNY